jgi:hypothetical protein
MTQSETSLQAPTGVNALSMGTDSIQITWNSVSGATGYRIHRSGSAGGNYVFIGSASSSPYTDNGLSPGTTYFYRISTVRNAEESGLSGHVSAATQTGGGTVQNPPPMPTGLVVTSASPGSVSLSWNSVSTATSYNVYRAATQTGTAARVTTVTDTFFTNNIPANNSYFYTVAAENSSGESPRSNTAFAFAVSHSILPDYGSSHLRSIAAGERHYFRLAVTQGFSYTIEWQDGNSQNTLVNVSAWQNNGTQIFNRNQWNTRDGYTNPSVFTATATGFITIEVHNPHNSNQDYKIYYY